MDTRGGNYLQPVTELVATMPLLRKKSYDQIISERRLMRRQKRDVKGLSLNMSVTSWKQTENARMPLRRPQSKTEIVSDPSSVTMNLKMMCEEDDLSPAQLAAFAKAKKEYETSQAKIAEARRNGWVVSESARTVTTVTSDDEDDVIVVEESVSTTDKGRPKRKSAANVSVIAKNLASGKKTTQVRIAPQPGLTITDVRGSVASWQTLSSTPAASSVIQSMLSPLSPPTAAGSLILAHQLGTNQRVLIPQEQFQKLLPGQFTFIKTVNTKPATATLLPSAYKAGTTPQAQAGKKRQSDSFENTPNKKRSRDSQPQIEGGKWVPLDEYYYGRQEGDPMYREEKGKFSFKCWYCHKMLYNNVRLISHMQGHIDSEKQQNLDLTDLTQCKHCHRQFDTPFEMQCHIEKVHQSNSDTLLCRICEKDLPTLSSLRQHMRMVHVACEMPYICQLCSFRSSVHSDVVDHFKKRHDSSQNVLCYYCLKVFRIHFTKGTEGWGQTQYFYKHLQLHQIKMRSKKCNQCKLMFVQSHSEEAKMHKRRDHVPNYKGIDIIARGLMKKTMGENQEQVMIQVLDPLAPVLAIKSLNAPTMAKVQEMRGLRLSRIPEVHHCKECDTPMNTLDHFKKHLECSLCYFSTTCHLSYTSHMAAYHAGQLHLRGTLSRAEKRLDSPLYCLCSYKSSYGNTMAIHLVSCSKMTAYFNVPEAKFFEYDDEQEDFNPFEPYVEEPESPEPDSNVPTMFAALGLVKRSVKSANGSSGSKVGSQGAADSRKYSTDSMVSPSKPPMKVLQPQHKRSSLLSSLPIKVPITPQNDESSENKDAGASAEATKGSSVASTEESKNAEVPKASESKDAELPKDSESKDAELPKDSGSKDAGLAKEGEKENSESKTEPMETDADKGNDSSALENSDLKDTDGQGSNAKNDQGDQVKDDSNAEKGIDAEVLETKDTEVASEAVNTEKDSSSTVPDASIAEKEMDAVVPENSRVKQDTNSKGSITENAGVKIPTNNTEEVADLEKSDTKASAEQDQHPKMDECTSVDTEAENLLKSGDTSVSGEQ